MHNVKMSSVKRKLNDKFDKAHALLKRERKVLKKVTSPEKEEKAPLFTDVPLQKRKLFLRPPLDRILFKFVGPHENGQGERTAAYSYLIPLSSMTALSFHKIKLPLESPFLTPSTKSMIYLSKNITECEVFRDLKLHYPKRKSSKTFQRSGHYAI